MARKKRKSPKAALGWDSGITSMNVGKTLRIVPHWEQWDTRADRLNIISDPGPTFGGQNHPTTVMALEFIERVLPMLTQDCHRPSFLDIGTGSGILAVTAAALGAGFNLGIDPDPLAISTARRNIQLNSALFKKDSVKPELVVGEIYCVGRSFDLVAANLIGPLLIRIFSEIQARVSDVLILSGIGDQVRDRVLGVYGSDTLELEGTASRDGWNAAVLKKKRGDAP